MKMCNHLCGLNRLELAESMLEKEKESLLGKWKTETEHLKISTKPFKAEELVRFNTKEK